jgi:DNA polymerase-3 subunit gamma/tau
MPLDLGAWKQKLAHFGSNPEPRMQAVPPAPLQEAAPAEAGGPDVPDLAQLRVEWHQFLDHLVKQNQQVMVSHLHSCELTACSPAGMLELSCCRKFSFEELLHHAVPLESELAGFYQLPLKLKIRYDAERDACTREKTVFTLFQELSEKNEVVRFIISEFGGELVY